MTEITRETPSITIDGKTYFIVPGPEGRRLVIERRMGRPLKVTDTRVAERVLAGIDVPVVS